MATGQGTSRLVYRRGRLTDSNFTPRPGIDTVGRTGQFPELSVSETLSLRRGDVAQVIDVTLLQSPLHAVPDDVAAGGTPGHVAIVPLNAAGEVD